MSTREIEERIKQEIKNDILEKIKENGKEILELEEKTKKLNEERNGYFKEVEDFDEKNPRYQQCVPQLKETYDMLKANVLRPSFWENDNLRSFQKGNVNWNSYLPSLQTGICVYLTTPNPHAAVWICRSHGLFARIGDGKYHTYYPKDKTCTRYNVIVTRK